MKPATLFVLLFLFQETPAPPGMTVLADAWPKMPRTVGQKFGMNTRTTIPAPELGGERDDLEGDEIGKLSTRRSAWRIVAVRVASATAFEGTVHFPQVSDKRDVKIRAGESMRVFLVLADRPGTLKVELRDAKGAVVGSRDEPLTKAVTGPKSEAELIAWELAQEQKVRPKFPRLPFSVQVRDIDGKPLAGPLTFIHAKLGLRVEAPSTGDWSGVLLNGDWQVYARGQVDPKPVETKDPRGTVATEKQTCHLYYLAGTLSAEKPALKLAPERSAPITAAEPLRRLSVWPTSLSDPLRYEAVHAVASGAFILRADLAKGLPVFHSTANLAFDMLGWSGPRTILSAQKLQPKEAFELAPPKSGGGTLTVDPSRLAGCDRIELRLSFPDLPRESTPFSATGPIELEVPAGPVRVSLTAEFKNGTSFTFSPHVVTAAPGKPIDLTPTGLTVTPYYQESRGLMVWVAVEDSLGRVVTHITKPKGAMVGSFGGKELFRKDFSGLTHHFPEDLKVSLQAIQYDITLDAGGVDVKSSGKAKPRKQFVDAPASVVVPENLEERARSIMPMIRKTLAGALKTFGLPKFDLTLRFEIRLPPDVGGLGGGGMIQLDLGEILHYAHETDRLPGAYTHELGHCLGFGHDPYMTMAPCGVDEGLFGAPGYLTYTGAVPGRMLDYIDREADAAGEWNPSGDLYSALRMLYGPETHAKMFAERTRLEARMTKAGFSIPEQMAAYYAEATGDATAWIFRAYGWPVFDYRLWLARTMIKNQNLAAANKLPKKIDGTYLTTWWVRGPIKLNTGAAPKELPPWKVRTWDGRFLTLADEDDFLVETGHHFHLTLRCAEEKSALLAIASDVQVSFYLNGKRISRVAAAPQFAQPRHDGFTLERANATVIPLTLHGGDNILEMTVVKPGGSRGLFVEFAGADGKPVKDIGFVLAKGPDDAELKDAEKTRQAIGAPVFNPSFETGATSPSAWIKGAKDGDGELVVALEDGGAPQAGKRCVRLEAKAGLAGSLIQRIVVEERGVYEFTGWMKTANFRPKLDKSWVMLFTGGPEEDEGIVRTQVVDTNLPGWTRVTFKWIAEQREIYIGCVLRSGAGAQAWFDGFSLIRLK